MNILPRYRKGDRARFDFRVPDGLGHWAYPDWDDPGLKVEILDATGALRLTATVVSRPGLVQGDDYHEEANPEGGPFVLVDGIELSDFALGAAEARVYAKVDGMPVYPYPTCLPAFEVVAGEAPGPLYTTVDKVKMEVPGTWPETVTEEMVSQAIADMSRRMDAFLQLAYEVPFPDVASEPGTPPLLEAICRKLAAFQCLEWMGRVNAVSEYELKERAFSDLLQLAPAEGKAPLCRLPGYRGPMAAYAGGLVRSDEEEEEDVRL